MMHLEIHPQQQEPRTLEAMHPALTMSAKVLRSASGSQQSAKECVRMMSFCKNDLKKRDY